LGCCGWAVWAFAAEDNISRAARQAIALVNALRISSALLNSTLVSQSRKFRLIRCRFQLCFADYALKTPWNSMERLTADAERNFVVGQFEFCPLVVTIRKIQTDLLRGHLTAAGTVA
jgi:hypothetical protein